MALLILDTTFFIDLFERDTRTIEFWENLRASGIKASFSAITVYELWLRERDDVSVHRFYLAVLAQLEEAAFAAEAARLAAGWLEGRTRRGRERLFRDAAIAATARQRAEVVCTRNIRDFRNFPVEVRPY